MQLTVRKIEPTEPEVFLGLVWLVESSYPMLSAGLERTLKTKARIHQGPKPPDEAPSAVIYCANGEDVASEVSRLKASAPDVPVLVLGPSVDLSLARSTLRAKADGFLHAAMSPEQIVRALSVALRGEVVIPRQLLREVLMEQATVDLSSVLRPRKREILELVAKGLSNTEIARHLYLSESTVKQHLRGAYKILGVKNRTEAARVFQRSDQFGPPATFLSDTRGAQLASVPRR